MIGRNWQDARRERDWPDWDPVLDADGRIVDVYPAGETIEGAVQRGWVYSVFEEVYYANGPLADIVVTLLARDETANGGSVLTAIDVATQWLHAGFDALEVRNWLDARVYNAHHAHALRAEGLRPADMPKGVGWLSATDVQAILDAPKIR